MIMTNGNTPSPLGSDPFFWLPADSEWNACIGRQGDEDNCVDGYIEAAIELADAVIEKRMYGNRDTLVMPILYNARHALELLLKFVINQLHEWVLSRMLTQRTTISCLIGCCSRRANWATRRFENM
jgi:hypothetical protein